MPMSKAEAGRIGGLTTLDRYGPKHFAAIGRLGFEALARKIGPNGRREAYRALTDKGRIAAATPATAEQLHQLRLDLGVDAQADDED